MSIQAAHDFRQQVNQNAALQAEVARLIQNGSVDYAGLAGLARQHGHDVSTEDVSAALSAASDELSEFEMELVSGGFPPMPYPVKNGKKPFYG